jgi:hypothetical protein
MRSSPIEVVGLELDEFKDEPMSGFEGKGSACIDATGSEEAAGHSQD